MHMCMEHYFVSSKNPKQTRKIEQGLYKTPRIAFLIRSANNFAKEDVICERITHEGVERTDSFDKISWWYASIINGKIDKYHCHIHDCPYTDPHSLSTQ